MTDSTPTPATPDADPAAELAEARLLESEIVDEDAALKGWLPEGVPTDGPAPAP